MDAALVHLTVHHFPVVLSLAGALSALGGMLLRRSAATRFGAISLLLAGAAAPVAYISGKLAAPAVRSEAAQTAAALRPALEAHETSGLVATAALVLAGLAAAAWLKRGTNRRAATMVLLGLASAGLAALAGWEGGRIRHPEFGSGRLEDLDRRDILVRLGPQVGEDVVQLDDHSKQLLI